MNEKLLTDIIDSAAGESPNAIWLRYPRSGNPSEYSNITYLQLAGAVDSLAWFLQEHVSKNQPFEPVVYIGPQDARYPLFTYACIKAGLRAVFLSPRNSKASNMDLIRALKSSTLATTDPAPMASQQLQGEDSVHSVIIPTLEELLERPSKPFPFDKTFAKAKEDPFVVLHTSGSTGHPKPITYTHEFWTRNANAFQLPVPSGYQSIASLFYTSRLLCQLPLFHMAGFCFATIMPLFFKTTVVLPPSDAPPSTNSLVRSVEHADIDWATVAPSIIEDLGKDPDMLARVSKRMQCLAFGGGKPSAELGDAVSRRIRIHNLVGSSECGGFAQLLPEDGTPESELWSYVAFHPGINSAFEQHSADSHELVIKRHRGQSTSGISCQAIFLQCPEEDRYKTRDLFRQHPDFPGFWQHQGRIDDLIVFSNGEKTNPVAYEQQISSHPEVAGAVVCGSNQSEAGILIEPRHHAEDTEVFVDKIWPVVQDSNETAPAYARVAKSHICITSADKPMERSAKGTVRRHQVIQHYEEEITNMYEHSEESNDDALEADHRSTVYLTDPEAIKANVRTAILDVTGRDNIQNQDDLFALGVDSLQVNQIVRRLYGAGLRMVKPRTVYDNGSIDGLVAVIRQLSSSMDANTRKVEEANTDDATSSRLSNLEQMLALYKDKAQRLQDVDIYQAASTPSEIPSTQDTSNRMCEECILITGTTGYLGSYILDSLARDNKYPPKKIICLNRAEGGSETQGDRNKRHDGSLLREFPSDKVEFLTGNFGTINPSSDLGLPPGKLRRLLESVTMVIHNAWPVDFNLPLTGFQTSLDFLLNLVRFCQQAQQSPPLLLVSSIASVHNYGNETGGVIPESLINDIRAPEPGYGESKFIAEQILREAMVESDQNFTASVVRVGQLSGPSDSNGLWNRRDWVPRLVRSCRHLSAIPADLGVNDEVNWVPIDLAAKIVLEIMGHMTNKKGSFSVYQLLNPCRTSWGHLVPGIQAVLGAELANVSNIDTEEEKGVSLPAMNNEEKGQGNMSKLEVVSGKEWLQRLHQSEHDEQPSPSNMADNPAFELVDFFDGIFVEPNRPDDMVWAMDETAHVSATFRSLTSIQPTWMRRWVQGWLRNADEGESI